MNDKGLIPYLEYVGNLNGPNLTKSKNYLDTERRVQAEEVWSKGFNGN